MLYTIRGETVADLSAAAATVWTMKAQSAGKLNVKQIFAMVEEAIAAGGFSSVAGESQLTAQPSGGSEVELCSFTTGVAPAVGKAVGDQVRFTVNTTNVNTSQNYDFDADCVFRFKNKTAGTGGTVTGTLRIYLPIDQDLG